MRVLSVIIGILMLICGVSCMCTPLVTFMDAGYFIVIMVAVYGVIGIVRAIAEKHFGAGFVFSILSVIFGVTVLRPAGMAMVNGVKLNVVSDGEFIESGADIVVSSVDGNRICVSKAKG